MNKKTAMKGLPTNTLFLSETNQPFPFTAVAKRPKVKLFGYANRYAVLFNLCKRLYGISFMFHSYPARIYLFDL